MYINICIFCLSICLVSYSFSFQLFKIFMRPVVDYSFYIQQMLSFTDCMHLTDNPIQLKGLGNVQKWSLVCAALPF